MYTTKSWEAMVYGGVGSTHAVKPLPVTEDTATVVEVRRRDRDSYGEGYEGDREAYIIFQVGNRFFKKNFWESSFNTDDIDFFDDDIEEVYGEVITTIAFRPKER